MKFKDKKLEQVVKDCGGFKDLSIYKDGTTHEVALFLRFFNNVIFPKVLIQSTKNENAIKSVIIRGIEEIIEVCNDIIEDLK